MICKVLLTSSNGVAKDMEDFGSQSQPSINPMEGLGNTLLPSIPNKSTKELPCPLPVCTPRFLSKFELILSEEQVDYCNHMFAAGERSASSFYAWKRSASSFYADWETLKLVSLPACEKQAMQEVNTIFHCIYHALSCYIFRFSLIILQRI